MPGEDERVNDDITDTIPVAAHATGKFNSLMESEKEHVHSPETAEQSLVGHVDKAENISVNIEIEFGKHVVAVIVLE